MMKKVALVLALAALVSVGSAFAEHPSGWGIGLGFQFGDSWMDNGRDPGSRFSLFLKAPQLPIYWGISADILDIADEPVSTFGLSLTGDYFLFDKTLVPDIGLGWFLGVGGYFSFWRISSDEVKVGNVVLLSALSTNVLDFGVRVPIGLAFIPIDWLEVFLDVAPSVGLNIAMGEDDTEMDVGGGWQADIGVRFWL